MPELHAQIPEKYRSGMTAVYDPQNPPSYFLDENSKLVGNIIEIQDLVAAKLGLKLRVEQAKFSGIIAGLLGSRYDLSAFQDTPERRAQMDFVDFLKTGTSVLVRKGNPVGLDFNTLCGRKIGTAHGSNQAVNILPRLQAKCAADGKPAIEVVVLPGPNEGALALKAGRVEGWIDATPYIGYMITNSKGEFEKTKTSDVVGVTGFAFRKGDPMVPLFKQAVQAVMNDGSYMKVIEKWNVHDLALDRPLVNGE
jgi:polar amino acid transport system substrate-binding protein